MLHELSFTGMSTHLSHPSLPDLLPHNMLLPVISYYTNNNRDITESLGGRRNIHAYELHVNTVDNLADCEIR